MLLYPSVKITDSLQSMIDDAWVLNYAYTVGKYCIDGNVLYKCKIDHTSTASNRPPYASYWDAVSVASELKTVNTNISTTNSKFASYTPLLMERLKFKNNTAAVVLKFYVCGYSYWPQRSSRFEFLGRDSAAYVLSGSWDKLSEGGVYGSGFISSEYTYSATGPTSGRINTHSFKVDLGTCIRLQSYSRSNSVKWYSSRSTGSLIGTGKYCYVRIKSTSVTLSIYGSATEDYPTTTASETERYLVSSGTVEYMVSNE